MGISGLREGCKDLREETRAMVNRMEKFGVRQRCMEGEKQLIDLFLVSLHYER